MRLRPSREQFDEGCSEIEGAGNLVALMPQPMKQKCKDVTEDLTDLNPITNTLRRKNLGIINPSGEIPFHHYLH